MQVVDDQTSSGRAVPIPQPDGTGVRRRPSYRPDIDGLRALAILAVVAFHGFPAYTLVETSRRSARLAALLAVVCLAVGGVGWAAASARWVPRSAGLHAMIVDAAADWAYPTPDLKEALVNGKRIGTRRVGDESVLFLGDSNVEQYWPRIKRLLDAAPDRSRSVYFVTGGSCAPVPAIENRANPYCQGMIDTAMEVIERERIGSVVLAAQWWAYFDEAPDQTFFVNGRSLRDPDVKQAAFDSLQQMMTRLVRSGHPVSLVLNVPVGLAFDPKQPIDRITMSIDPGVGGESLSVLRRRHDETTRRLSAAAQAAGAVVIDPMRFLCDQERDVCPARSEDGVPLYKDAAHLRASFVREGVGYLDEVVKISPDAIDRPRGN